jgi:hypothetical protein
MSNQIISAEKIPFKRIRKELTFDSILKKGSRGKRVEFVQEAVSFAGFKTAIDGDFGPATKKVVEAFQKSHHMSSNGIVDRATFDALTKPFRRAFSPIEAEGSLSELVILYARQHLKEHPIEIGGQNRGPWVRFYMDGHQGTAWPWCAGFVTMLVKQAAKYHNIPASVARTYSCDVLAVRAKTKGQFVSEKAVAAAAHPADVVPAGSLFLVRRTKTDWTHTGLVIKAGKNTFTTIEGNTNDAGHAEGYEVCMRTRGYKKRDFIVYS